MTTHYCIDTSALVDLGRYYPSQRFPSLWDRLGDLADRAVLIAPDIVYTELERGSDRDEVLLWCKRHMAMFLPASGVQEEMRELMNIFRCGGIDINSSPCG